MIILPSTKHEKIDLVDGMPSTVNKSGRPHEQKKREGAKDRKAHRHQKYYARYDNRINTEILKKIKQFCLDHNLSQQQFAELSAVQFMDNFAVHTKTMVDGILSHDDGRLMMYKTRPTIINHYLRYNPKNKW